MNKTILAIVVILVVVIGGYLIFARRQAVAPTQEMATTTAAPSDTVQNVGNTPAAPQAAAPTNTATHVAVAISNMAFAPATLTVKAGTIVTWTNNDSVPHTVTSDSGTTLNSPRLTQGGTYSMTFSQPGTYTYHCAVHPMMKGTVVVQ